MSEEEISSQQSEAMIEESENSEAIIEESGDSDHEDQESEDQQPDEQKKLNPEEFEKQKIDKFGQIPIMETEKINNRLNEVKQSFYNRLESAKLIKKQGKIPFLEHMTVTNPQAVHFTEAA
jgi:hypothetical protein